MKIGILGCGAIGGTLSFYLSALCKDNLQVVLRNYQKDVVQKEGLLFQSLDISRAEIKKPVLKLEGKVDLLITTTKIYDIEDSFLANKSFLEESLILTTQNGIGAEKVISKFVPEKKIYTGIVMFGSTFYPPNKIVENFKGSLAVGSMYGSEIASELKELQEKLQGKINVVFSQNVLGQKYLKLLINLNNAVAAILGCSMQKAFQDKAISALAIDLLREAVEVIDKSGIELVSLPDFPQERITGFLQMERQRAADLYSQIMTNLSKKELFGSILQSIKRKRKTEIDFINGEIVRLAQENNLEAPLNARIVSLVKEVEEKEKFLKKEELLKEVK